MAAGTSIFTLMGSIFVDNEKANESIGKTEGKAGSLAEKLGGGIKSAAKWGAALTGAAVGAGSAMLGMAKKASDTGDNVDKMSQKIGVSKSSFQELDYVLGQNGADVNVLQKGFQSLTGIMDKTADATNKGQTALDKLGISVKDNNGNMKKQEQVFNESVKALMKMPEGVERSTLASELFGKKVASELVPMLNAGVDSYDELTQKAHDLGYVMSDEAVDSAAKFNDSMDDVKKSLGGVMTKVGSGVMPIFQKGLDWVLKHMPDIQKIIQKVFKGIENFASVAMDVFKSLLPVLKEVFKAVVQGVKSGIELISKLVKALLEFYKNNKETFDKIGKVFKELFGVIREIMKSIMEIIKFVWDIIAGIFTKYGDAIMNIISAVFGFIKDYIGNVLKIIKDVIDTVMAILSGDWGKAWEGIKNIVFGIFKLIVDYIKGMFDIILNIIIGLGPMLWDVAKGAFNLLWEGIKFIFGKLIEWMWEIVKLPVKIVLGIGGALFDAGVSIFSALWDGIKSIWTGISNWVSEKVKWITDKVFFWRKSDKEMDKDEVSGRDKKPSKPGGPGVSGSKAGGLAYVPFDGYRAELHKGERVLTRQENEATGKASTVNHTGTIRVEGYNSEGEFSNVVDIIMDKLRREVRTA